MSNTNDGDSWFILIEEAMEGTSETLNDIEYYVCEKYVSKSLEVPPVFKSYFTAWTKNRVYFPVTHDGREWVDSVPRNPCNEATKHVGA